MKAADERAYLAHVDATCLGCELCDEDLQWEAIWNGPTAAQVKATSRVVAQVCRQSYVAEWRQKNGIAPHVKDAVVAALMDIEQVGRRP